ncbi:octaprenyl diphosphate synthase [Tepidiphilus margaritifer]|uniref:octaprenyl diphosphate synthase n=1 Tax=Tepidiphilus margaritifer TaxID=203471 RepID=UPI0004273FE0|nr:octaprenyl diphosphate synthase [Tepidiphilus margaritifer]
MTPTPTIKEIFAPLQPDMARTDEVIRRELHSDVALVRSIADYIIAAGGKRLRPALLLAVARALGYEGLHHATLAAVVEFIHTATLLHDDVVDESDLRRGRETANAVFGNAAAVLVGDFLYSRSFQMMVSVGSMRVMAVLAEATNVIAEGEVLQLMNQGNPETTLEDYFRVIEYKTAKLFEAAGRLGAILAGAAPEVEEAMAAFGRELGCAFQIIDDVLDYAADPAVSGKNVGDDLAEGKPTLPLLHVLHHGTPAQASLIRQVIEQGGREHLSAVLEAIAETGALEASRRVAERYAATAKTRLACLSPSQFRESLLQLSDFAVNRSA